MKATVLLLGVGLALTSSASAQVNTAEIRGVVTDPTGARIRGIQIAVVQGVTKAEFTTVSDEQGHFDLPQMPVGEYTLTAEATGVQAVRGRTHCAAGQRS